MLFVCHSNILHRSCCISIVFSFPWELNWPQENTENNAYAKFWGHKQRALWYVMVLFWSGQWLQHPLRPRGSQSGRKKGRDERNTGETVRRLGTIIQSIFCAQSGVGIRLNFWTVVRWQSVPRGSFARTWKLSSRPFSRPDWLPPGSQRMWLQ